MDFPETGCGGCSRFPRGASAPAAGPPQPHRLTDLRADVDVTQQGQEARIALSNLRLKDLEDPIVGGFDLADHIRPLLTWLLPRKKTTRMGVIPGTTLCRYGDYGQLGRGHILALAGPCQPGYGML